MTLILECDIISLKIFIINQEYYYEKAILFDLDGTLWHTSDVILPKWNEVLKKHPETQKQITLEEMNSYMGKTIEQIANIMFAGA